ncbi:MAG: TonB-dependent receptor [Gammaproteobacteria bacterium]|nr:MAG: TonB-dependent receptor [Gammaproteobacteria bacterium]
MNFTKSPLTLAVTSALLFSFTTHVNANANDENSAATADIEIITVTGGFRQQNLLKTASALSVLTDIEIKQRNAQHLEELIAVSPNVNFASGSQRARYYQIRGIGERSQFKEPINSSVGLIIDDVDFTGIGSIASLFDVEQVEIFRGPQGTRFGANALAGMINIITNAPTDEFEGTVKLDAGNYNSYGLGLALSGPVSDSVNYRLAANKYTSDGFIENTYLKKNNTNNRDETSLRGKLSIQASNNLTVDLSAFYFDFDNGYDAFSLDTGSQGKRKTLSDQPGFDQQKTSALAAKLTYQGFEKFTFVTLLSHASSDLAYGYDEDWAYVGISAPENIENQDYAYWEYSSTDYYFRDRSTQTVEFRALSNSNSQLFNDSTTWIVGFYFKNDDEDLQRQYTYLDSDFTSTFDTQSIAIFAQLDTKLNSQWHLTTGFRVEQRSADYINSDDFIDNPVDTMVGGKLVLSYQHNDDSFWYGSINRGYKAGGANTDGSLPDDLRTFEPEYLVNYELGYKVSLLDNTASIRTAVFYMDRTDVQVNSSKTLVRGDGSSEFISYLGNAATGSNRGIEIEANWQLTDLVELYGSLGLLDTVFNDFINANGESLSGREQAHAPNYQFNLGVNIQPSEYWLINLSADGKDAFYFSDSHNEKSESVALVNASISYLDDNYQIKVWARNLTDENYANRGFYFGNDPRDGYTAKQYTQLSEPLVFGVTVDYQF